ncbi:hypothetical protein VNI00_008416 [Paramarasmius palmivorus]|uniref:Glycoside hydrolase family 92 protein n=1 Tax=Paramarasmius palmivorus TaxID=297713 RepID=A0AAW0CY32_9AGAR
MPLMSILFWWILLLLSRDGSSYQGTNPVLWPLLPLKSVNPLIGTTGPRTGMSGGMIPSVSHPFGSVRWVVQNQKNFVAAAPFNYSTSGRVHGFMGTRQPAVWMGESAWAGIVPGVSLDGEPIKTDWNTRAMYKVEGTEEFGIGHYAVRLMAGNDSTIQVDMSATSRAAHFVFSFDLSKAGASSSQPYIWLPVTRDSVKYHAVDTYEPYFPNGTVSVIPSEAGVEICGSNEEFDDIILVPLSVKPKAQNFRGWFCTHISFLTFGSSGGYQYGVTQAQMIYEGVPEGKGTELGAYVLLPGNVTQVEVRIGTSLISASQARANRDTEIPQGQSLADTRSTADMRWAEKLGRFEIDTTDEETKTIFYTSVWRGMQDTYRAAWALQLLFAPERIPGMIRSMLHDFEEAGRLPMWKNIAETNIMVGTHSNSLLGEAVRKGFGDMIFKDEELQTMWNAVWKDCTVPPVRDDTVVYRDREEVVTVPVIYVKLLTTIPQGVDFEARAGLSTYYGDEARGWVADDIHSESASRTLDYAYDDHAAAVLSAHLSSRITSLTMFPNGTIVSNVTQFLENRAISQPWVLWNADATSESGRTKGFIQARTSNGSWAGPVNGFTEGDRFVYSFAIVHAIQELIQRRGGNIGFVASLDEFFEEGRVNFANEPAHHTPYLYTLSGAPEKAARWVREMARTNYNNTPNGLSGNEDCGQMSAWYIFSAMGFYPVNPVSGEYVVGSPFFSRMIVHIPVPPFIRRGDDNVPIMDPFKAYNSSTGSYVLHISAPGAEGNIFVKSISVNGRRLGGDDGSAKWVLKHEEIMFGGLLEYDMAAEM